MTTVDGSSLVGVSTTALWTLRIRAIEAKRPNGVLEEPWVIALFDAIDYDCDTSGISGARTAGEVPPRPDHGMSKLLAWRFVDRLGPLRHVRPSITLLEFA
jgi:O-methyltransferase involved in polyketide biosynthesis